MSALLAEFFGTCMLIIFGNGVVANVLLEKSKGQNSGWLVINFGWALAVFIAVYCTAAISGAHLNPAVTVALAVGGSFDWSNVTEYILAQMGGAILGASCVWVLYKPHFDATEDGGLKLACFSTGPAIKNTFHNLFSEIFVTMVFIIAILFIKGPEVKLGALEALPVSLVVLAIGLSLGGTTGYAINPARDLGPRIAHALLPMKYKGSSGWEYAWIPVVGPILGGIIASMLYMGLTS